MSPLLGPELQPMRDALTALEQNNMPGLVATMTDAVVYVQPDGTELTGKQAVADYWSDRRGTQIKTLALVDRAVMGMNLFRTSTATPLGKYLMAWFVADVTYLNGRSLKIPVHVTVHLDASGKIDRWNNFYDTRGIAEATAQ